MPDQGTIDALLTSDAFSQNPYPVYDHLRKEKPLYWSNAVGAWLLTWHDDVQASLRDDIYTPGWCHVQHVVKEAPPLGRGGPVEVPGPESEDGREGAPGVAEDGGPARHGDVIATQRAIHGNVPDVHGCSCGVGDIKGFRR